jgi:hypothetical protein
MLHGIQNRLKFHLHIRPLVMGSTGGDPVHNQRSSFFPRFQPANAKPQPRRPIRRGGRAAATSFEPLLALPPVATRNGLAPPRRIGAPTTPENQSTIMMYTANHPAITHKLFHRPEKVNPSPPPPPHPVKKS